MYQNLAIGGYGEELAIKFLKKQKYKILEKNFRTTIGEIDIIAKHQKYLVFIEVKTRTSQRFGLPREAVNEYKQAKIQRVAEYYQKIKKLWNIPIRFDVIDILDGKIEHFIGAW